MSRFHSMTRTYVTVVRMMPKSSIQHFFLIILFAFTGMVLMTACASNQVIQTPPPTPKLTPKPTPTPYGYFTSTLTSPDGKIVLPMDCYRAGTDTQCVARFPNGRRTDIISGIWWSPENRFAVICIQATHDSPGCLRGYGVWNMADGTKLDWYMPDAPGAFFKWKQSGYVLAYYYEPGYRGLPRDKVGLLNAETGEKSFTTECPDWLLVATYSGGERPTGYDWHKVCDKISQSTITP